MRLFMKGVLACLFLSGMVLCALAVWPAALVIWNGKILLDVEGLESLTGIATLFLMGVATCAATAVGYAQLDIAAGRDVLEPPPRQKSSSSTSAVGASSPSEAEHSPLSPGLPTGPRRAAPNPLK